MKFLNATAILLCYMENIVTRNLLIDFNFEAVLVENVFNREYIRIEWN